METPVEFVFTFAVEAQVPLIKQCFNSNVLLCRTDEYIKYTRVDNFVFIALTCIWKGKLGVLLFNDERVNSSE